MTTFIVYTDGSTKPKNPGHSGYGAVLYADNTDGEALAREGGYIGDDLSNNQAEYAGLIAGLILSVVYLHSHVTNVIVRSDSQIVLNQVSGNYVVRAAKLGPLYAGAIQEIEILKSLGIPVTFEHVRGHKGEVGNEAADEMAGKAVDERLTAHTKVMKHVEESRKKATITKKGHEKLRDLVTKLHNVTDLSSGFSAGTRELLNRQGTDLTSMLVLQFPSLMTIKNGRTHLLSLSTGFKRVNGIAVRTMDLAAFTVASALATTGYNIVVIHRPHSKDHWMTDVELGWGATGKESPMAYLYINDLEAGEVFTKDGWPPFVELKAKGDWHVYDK